MRKDALQRDLPAPDEACAKHHYLHQGVEAPDLATIRGVGSGPDTVFGLWLNREGQECACLAQLSTLVLVLRASGIVVVRLHWLLGLGITGGGGCSSMNGSLAGKSTR
jgi:hypothetical protein